jgi:hypothetical protein
MKSFVANCAPAKISLAVDVKFDQGCYNGFVLRVPKIAPSGV